MVQARNLLRRHVDNYGGSPCFEADHSNLTMMMADHQKPTSTTKEQQGPQAHQAQESEPPGTSSSSSQAPDDSWLQLGIGLSSSPSRPPSVELQLFSDRPSSLASATSRPIGPAQMGYRPIGPSPSQPPPPPWGYFMAGSSSSSNVIFQPQPQFYNVQRFPPVGPAAPPMAMRVAGPPPARQQGVGVWFLLKAAENQVREPFLPQIPKSFIRIKDGRMTVRLLMKYLVKKLGLDDESEVQITCRGQPLLPFFTLQHVRDHIWCLSGSVAFLPDSPSLDHVMTLQYGRSR